jgi:hypothetical protein
MHLTQDALGTIGLDALAPVKKLLKRFFSDEPWTAADDAALADLVGADEGMWSYELDGDLVLDFGWSDGVFAMTVAAHNGLGETFAGSVVPEATPNPRTIRFVTPQVHDGPSRWYESATAVDDPRVARLFAEFDDVANVLVGPSFVAVGVHHPDRWEQLLDPMLRVINAEFTSTSVGIEPTDPRDPEPADAIAQPSAASAHQGETAVERVWKELGSLRPDEPGDLERILAAASSSDTADRQVAARVLVDAGTDVAQAAWGRLLDDPSRGVRRATVDAMVDVARPTLRSLLEKALGDTDAWTRWKALRGLVELGVEPSRAAVVPLEQDPDFRVRLEAAGALRRH